jgi:hypothetical protein
MLTACDPEVVIPTPDIPTAGVRFLHLAPDLGSVDFRFVDLVENSAHWNMAFRASANFYYKNARAGERHLRIFRASSSQEIASQVLFDERVTLEAGKRYTFLIWGYSAGTPAMRFAMIEDNPDDPGNSIALRIVNAAVTHGPLDIRHYPHAGTVPTAASWANVAPMTVTTYLTAATGQRRINVQPAGGGTALFADALALVGVAATIDIEAAPGTTVAGTAVSNFIVPRSVAGSPAAPFTTPGMISAWDRRPPRTCQFC